MQERAIFIVNDVQELKRKFEYFIRLLDEKIVKSKLQKDMGYIETETHNIEFVFKSKNRRGLRCHQVFNLTQDLEFDTDVAKLMERLPFEYVTNKK